jgi:hypothetical protein
MKKFFLATTLILTATAAPTLAADVEFEQVGTPHAIHNGVPQFPKYQILVPYILQLKSKHEFLSVNCSLFVNGKLVGTAMDILKVSPGKVRSSGVTFIDVVPDTAECSAKSPL